MEHDAGASSELADGTMSGVEIGGRKILLTRVNNICHAVENRCPHAGAPLDQGILHGDVVICPWHKAAFQASTGQCREPPAVDDLPNFPVRETDGRILVTIATHDVMHAQRVTDESDKRCMAIVGAGAAGAMAAQTLREEGFSGRVLLIGREDVLPYDRTVLSKYALSGKQGGEKTPLQDSDFYVRTRIERIVGNVLSIDPASRRIGFADRSEISYDAALVATGGAPRKPDLPGSTLAGVFTLRSAADAQAIVAASVSARFVVVAGSGFIAMECAASLRERGLDVTVVAPQSAPFERQLGKEVGQVFKVVHEGQGIKFRLGDEVGAVEGDGFVQRVRLRSGQVLAADFVVFGLGVSPATDMLAGIAKLGDRGIPVDSRLRVTDGLYAAGDIAAFPMYGNGERIRVEHWRVAQQHGRIAALNMLGGDHAYRAVPYFWTIHFMKRLDYVGHAETWDEVVIDGDLGKPKFVAYYVKDRVVSAVAGWDRDAAMAAATVLMTGYAKWAVKDLRKAMEKFA